MKDFHERDSPGSKVRVLREIMRQRAAEDTDMEIHVSQMTESFQKLLAFGEDLKPEFFMSATLLGSLPSSYDALITALEARKEEELTSSLVRAKIIEEYRRRKDRDDVYAPNSNALKVSNQGTPQNAVTCFFCKKKGHPRNECRKYAKWKSKKDSHASGNLAANIVEQHNQDEMLFMVGTNTNG